MLLICISHATQTSLNFIDIAPSLNPQIIFTGLFFHFGQLGNVLFIVSSSYFLINSNKTKLNKIIDLILDTMIISIIFLITYISFGYRFDYKTIISHIFTNLNSWNWFIPTYIVFYAVHPLLNKIIKNIDQRTHFIILICSIFFFGILSYSSHAIPICSIMSFIVIYFCSSFFFIYKKTFCANRKKNGILLATSLLSLISLYFLYNFGGLKCPWLARRLTIQIQIINPFLFLIAFSLLNILSTCTIHSKVIRYIASLSLYVYVIHENGLFRSITRVNIYKSSIPIFNNQYLAIDIVLGISCFVFGVVLAILYKETFRRLISSCSKKITALFNKLYQKVYLKFNKNNEIQK